MEHRIIRIADKLHDIPLEKSEDERYLMLVEHIKLVIDELEKLKVVSIRNGGGRLITMDRSDFYQLLYDMPRERFAYRADFAAKTSSILDLVWKLCLIAGTIMLISYLVLGRIPG